MMWLTFTVGFLLGFAASGLVWWTGLWLEGQCWEYQREED